MAIWKTPPQIKLYEALGCLADNRIVVNGNTAIVTSSSGNKRYTVTYDPNHNAIIANDNGSYWQGYLGYPSIAYLLTTNQLPLNPTLLPLLTNIKWKDLNTKFKNDWTQTEQYCQKLIIQRGGNLNHFHQEISNLYQYLNNHPLNKLTKHLKPPSGY